MKATLLKQLKALQTRHDELTESLADSTLTQDPSKFRNISKEYARLSPIVDCFRQYQTVHEHLHQNQTLLKEEDPELRAMAEEELKILNTQSASFEQALEILLIPQDPDDTHNVFLEIRAAAGGTEAGIFAGDLFRMYARYAETKGWTVEIISHHPNEQGGYKEIIVRLAGEGVYSKLKFESGAHRVQRVPTTEAQGRIHTSTCTVAVLAEADTVDAITINPAELRVDTFRASGAGGQHVQKTDSAIRIVHLPTGLTVECQDDRSQHKNRARAMSLLQARLLAATREKQQREEAATRRSLVGTGDRSERIRTYNFPQSRLTDHRINLTLYQLDAILAGALAPVIEPLQRHHQALQLMQQLESLN